MEYYGNRLCISYGELTDGIMCGATLQKNVQRGRIEQVRRGHYGEAALYAVDTLPLKYRTEVYRRNPDMKGKAESKPFEDSIEPDGEAMMYYDGYTLSDGRHLPRSVQEECANSAAIMNAFGRMITQANSHRKRQSKGALRVTEFWKKAAAALPRIGDKWPNTLPQNARRLQGKYNEYRKEGYEAFISGKWENSNSAKIDSEDKQAIMMQILAHHNNFDNATAARFYNNVAREKGWQEVSASTVANWKAKTDLTTSAWRRGATNFRNEKSMQVKRARPTMPMLMWTLDGWDCELLYQKTEMDKKGHMVTSYTNRLTLEVVLDPMNDYPIGYAIGRQETPELIKAALMDAEKHTRVLFGRMLRVNQLQADNYQHKAMLPYYRVVADKVTFARVKNAKAKVVEPYFGHINKTYCKLFNNWSGYGVTSNPKNQPNSDALNQLRHTFPTEDEVRGQIDKIMAMERKMKGKEMMEKFAMLPEERLLDMPRETYLHYFGLGTGYRNAMEGSGLKPTLLGEKRAYDCWDMKFREHGNVKWAVKYDPDDLTTVLAESEDGSLRFMMEEKYIQPMALAERKPGDAEQLARVRTFNKRLEQQQIDRLEASRQRTEELIADNPRLDNILGRLLIVNSDGQHKLPKAAKRLGTEVAEAEEIITTPKETDITNDYSIF